MALEGCYSCIKYLMFAFNFLFWILGCVILGIGIWIKVDPGSIKDLTQDEDVFRIFLEDLEYYGYQSIGAYVLIVIGSIIMVTGFLGCCGAIRESQCMLATFFIVLSIIFIALLVSGIYVIVMKGKLKDNISQKLYGQIEKVKRGDREAKKLMKIVQDKFHCCGADVGASDYGLDFVDSQCKVTETFKPCTPRLYEELTHKSIIIGGVAIGIASVMFLGMIFSMLLCCAIRENMA